MKNSSYILVVLLLIVGCTSEPKNTSTEDQPVPKGNKLTWNSKQEKNAGIRIGRAEEKQIGASIEVSGTVEVPPQNKTAISFPFGGFVKRVPVLDGMVVKKGQLLIGLEDPQIVQLQQDYLEALSELEFLENEYQRQKRLDDQQINSQKNLQQAKSAFLTTQARCKGMKIKLEMAGVSPASVAKGNLQREVSIRAPFDGVVTKMNAEVGHYASPQDVLLEIIDLKHGHIELSVFEKDIPALKKGQKVHVFLFNNPEPVDATVFLIGREIGANRMVKVHCHLDRENPEIIPGSFVKARIDLDNRKLPTVPSDAIFTLKGKQVVFVRTGKSDGKSTYEARTVTTLGEENGFTAIRFTGNQSVLSEELVIAGGYALLSALLIEPE